MNKCGLLKPNKNKVKKSYCNCPNTRHLLDETQTDVPPEFMHITLT